MHDKAKFTAMCHTMSPQYFYIFLAPFPITSSCQLFYNEFYYIWVSVQNLAFDLSITTHNNSLIHVPI